MLRNRLLRYAAASGSAAPLMLSTRTDVAAAYSLRRLLPTYAGPLIRVRRSSDSTEQDFGSGQTWVDWTEVLAFIAAGSGFVTKWYDQSGNARDVVQATAALQPQIGLLANGLPGMTFDGVDDYLRVSSGVIAQPLSFNWIGRHVTAAQANYNKVFDGGTSLADRNALLLRSASGHVNENAMLNSITFLLDNKTAMPVATRGAIGGCFNGASSIMEINAATISSFTAGGDIGTASTQGLTIGGSGDLDPAVFGNAEQQELILFNTAHSSAQLKADNAAMRAAWRF